MIIGIDEAGRGCWAGPLVAAAVMLPKEISGLADSKLLTRLQREHLYECIMNTAVVGVGWMSPTEVDALGLTKATSQAMERAMSQITLPFTKIIIDGNYNYLPGYSNVTTLIKADSLIAEVSAASIVAKVSRDRYMYKMAELYPEYGFEKHVGYGTKLHMERLKLNGVTELHRLSYKPIKELLQLSSV